MEQRRLGRRTRVTVVDRSMEPTLRPGDRLYVERLRAGGPPFRRGEIVVVTDPETPGRWLIKRVHASSDEPPGPGGEALSTGTVFLMGDNAEESRDSRHFGPVPIASVIGIVRHRYWPMARRGAISSD